MEHTAAMQKIAQQVICVNVLFWTLLCEDWINLKIPCLIWHSLVPHSISLQGSDLTPIGKTSTETFEENEDEEDEDEDSESDHEEEEDEDVDMANNFDQEDHNNQN